MKRDMKNEISKLSDERIMQIYEDLGIKLVFQKREKNGPVAQR